MKETKEMNKDIAQTIKNVIMNIVAELVSKPDEAKIHTSQTTTLLIYEIETNKNDVKYVIGEKGSTIQSIRNIIRAIAKKNNKNVQVEVLQPK